MEVTLDPDLETKLMRMAGEQGRNSSSLVAEAVERLVSHDEWFVHKVEVGLATADRGEFVSADVDLLCDYPEIGPFGRKAGTREWVTFQDYRSS